VKGNSCCSRPDFGTKLNALLPAIDEDEVVKKKTENRGGGNGYQGKVLGRRH